MRKGEPAMPNTVPNQNIIHIHRDYPRSNFLQIKKENWYDANKDLEPYGLILYLYLAGNSDGYDLALSQVAAEEAGIKKTTFHKYFHVLIDKGYLVHRQGNIYDFYERPQKMEEAVSPCEQENSQHELECSPDVQDSSQRNREIYKKIT
jgi:hypothetical protein